ncbi:MAG: FeoA domain-containing protein [Chthoniobacterales bacterium]|nr:FeoA domain-containing protein [Chthoniobacterales bacterium]
MKQVSLMKLGKIARGKTVEIMKLLSDCGRAGRLASLGFLPGRHVRVSRIAPLGDPISILMEGQEISLRRTEANLIEVREIS